MKNRLRLWCLVASVLASVFAFSTGVRGAAKQTGGTVTAADILRRDREGFLDGLNGYLFSTDRIKVALSLEDLWLLMDRLNQERKKDPADHLLYYHCNRLILAIAQVGGRRDLERLIQVWEGYPEDS